MYLRETVAELKLKKCSHNGKTNSVHNQVLNVINLRIINIVCSNKNLYLQVKNGFVR